MQNFAVNQALSYIEGNPEENIPKLMALVDRFSPDGWYETQRSAIREVIEKKNNWYQLILRLYELDPGVRKAFFQNFLFNASLKGSATQDEVKQRENCNVPCDTQLSLLHFRTPASNCGLFHFPPVICFCLTENVSLRKEISQWKTAYPAF